MKIEINNLSVLFNEKKALDNISLEISRPGIYSLIGKNGSGKTTLLNSIYGFNDISLGEVKINNLNVKDKKTFNFIKDNISYVFQFPDLQIFNNTIEKELSFYSAINKKEIDQNLIKEAMNHLNLKNEHLKDSPFKLSYGQKRKLVITSTTLNNQSIILLDEPTINLDRKNKDLLKHLLNKWKNENKIVIMISHDIDFVWEMSDYSIVLDSGKLVKLDETRKVLTDKDLLEKSDLTVPSIVEYCHKHNILDIPRNVKELAKVIYESSK